MISRTVDSEHVFEKYVSAREFVIDSGYEAEMDWQANRDFQSVDEQEFLRESAWVILNSGMREKIVRNLFPGIEKAFFGFASSTLILMNKVQCFEQAVKVFNYPRKITAILALAQQITDIGFENIKKATLSNGASYLSKFDYIGPVTCRHLAKNLGLPFSKPDRHLKKVASVIGYEKVSDLCRELSELSGDSVPVVDLVIWRFATLRHDYQTWFQSVH